MTWSKSWPWWVGLAVFGVVFFLDPVRSPIFPPCPLHALTGLNCPGCGSTRALHQLAHGDVVAAWRFNPLMLLSLPLIGWLVVRRDPVVVKPVWIWLFLVVVVAFGVLRNIPAYPFTMLAP